MKLLIAALCVVFTGTTNHLLIVDKNMKKPLKPATEFSTQDFMQHNFPVYTADKEAIIAAADKAAKWIAQAEGCQITDTVQTPHTFFVVATDCEEGRAVSVRLFTRVAETATIYSFDLVEHEPNRRKAQQRLMAFATYINQ